MYIGYILGLIFLPVSILIFASEFGFASIDKIIGIPTILIAAIGIILVEIGDIIDSHVQGSNVMLVYLTGFILALPGLLYLISLAVKLPAALTEAMPIMLASFLFVEGVSSFHIGE